MFKIGEKVIFVGIFGEEKEAKILHIYGCNGHNMYEIETSDKQRYNVSQSCLKKLDRIKFIFNTEVERIAETLKERKEMKNKKMNCDPAGETGPKGVYETWEAIKLILEGEKMKPCGYKKEAYVEFKDNKFKDHLGYDFTINNYNIINLKWIKHYEQPKNKCKDCAYRFKLQTGDIMCCKKVIDIEDDMHCKEFEYNEPSDDYIKAINALVKAIRESE